MQAEVGIIGGGISGLITAYLLHQEGIKARVYEANSEAGGAMKSHQSDGWIAEKGPNTIMARSQKLIELMKELGLNEELVFANPEASKRFIVRDKQPVAMPTSLFNFLTTDLFSIFAKLRLLKEPFVQKWSRDHEENLAEFVERRLGSEFLDYAINPFVAGVYAGDPQHLSVKYAFEKLYNLEQDYGSLIWGQIRGAKERKERGEKPKTESKLFSFQNGIQQLPERLSKLLDDYLLVNCRVDSVIKQNECWLIKANHNGNSIEAQHDAVIYTAPIHALDKLKINCNGAIEKSIFNNITYPPISVMALGFNQVHIAHELDGFGMLVPRKESFKILGTLFSSTLFPNRAPDGQVLLTTFIGGMRNPELAGLSTEELREMVIADLDELLGVIGGPVFEHHTYWPKSIPQYDVGYGRVHKAFHDIERQCPGFLFAGNYRYGISVSDCLSSGYTVRDRVIEFLY